jgi:hypothetical protein
MELKGMGMGITPRSAFLLEMLIVAQEAKKCPPSIEIEGLGYEV